jgi:hypothetical protein
VQGGVEQRFVVRDSGKVAKRAGLVDEFQVCFAEFLQNLAPSEPAVAFAFGRILRRQGANVTFQDERRGSPNADLSALMDFYTGRGEIARTLQSDRAMGLTTTSFRPSVSLTTIRGVEAPKRDYAALIGADRSLAATPVPGPLAKLLPRDLVAIEFSSIKDLVQLPKFFDERFDDIARALEGQPGSYRLVERYREQLIVEPSKLSEQLGHVAVGAVALLVGDPYLREGTDVSLVLEVRQRALVESVLAKYLDNAKAKHPNIETKTLQLDGTEVIYRGSPDGRIRQYSVWDGGHLWLSNSPKRLTQLLRIAHARESSLLNAEDYRWARRVAPYDATKERAHLFFGDEFVAHITGPRSKILEARRIVAQNELRAVEHAALLHAILEGAPARDKSELLKAGWLTQKDLKHFDGTPIDWTPESGATSVWGASSEMVPIVDLELSRLDRAEVDRYDSFRRSYEAMLRGALDPTSLRVLRTDSDSALRTELRILPLSPTGEVGRSFREIVRNVGRGSVDAGPAIDGIGAMLAISKDSPLRDLAQGMARGTVRNRDFALGFLGDWVKVGLVEDPLLFDFALSERAIPEVVQPSTSVQASESSSEREHIDVEANVHRIPVWAAVQIKSGMLLTAALAALRIELKDNLGDWITWSDAAKYRDVPVSQVDVKHNSQAENHATIYYAVAKDVLLVSLQRRILEQRIDDVLAGNRPKATPVDSRSTQLALDWSKKPGSIFSAILSGLLERSALAAHAEACAGATLLALGFGEEAVNATDGAVWLRYLGYEPLSPNGSGLRIEGGQCTHPVYGTDLEPALPAARDTTVPLHRAIDRLQRIRFGLGVVPRGSEQELFGTAEIAFE